MDTSWTWQSRKPTKNDKAISPRSQSSARLLSTVPIYGVRDKDGQDGRTTENHENPRKCCQHCQHVSKKSAYYGSHSDACPHSAEWPREKINTLCIPSHAHIHNHYNQQSRHLPPLRNAWVAGSSPAGGSRLHSCLIFCLLCVAVGRGTTGITNGFFAFFGQKRLARSLKKC
jgi:hypothetical protein